jgi:DMSO/TMAO reductase YedYZ molybdopterin-dependent catalytic subunit
MDYMADATRQWTEWRLKVSGLVKQPAQYSLAELKSMPSRTQITRHDCVEGWSAIGKWKGVPLTEITQRVEPTAAAKYVVFHCMTPMTEPTITSIDLSTRVIPDDPRLR